MFRHNVQAAASANGLSAIQALSAARERASSCCERLSREIRTVQSNRAPTATTPAHRF